MQRSPSQTRYYSTRYYTQWVTWKARSCQEIPQICQTNRPNPTNTVCKNIKTQTHTQTHTHTLHLTASQFSTNFCNMHPWPRRQDDNWPTSIQGNVLTFAEESIVGGTAPVGPEEGTGSESEAVLVEGQVRHRHRSYFCTSKASTFALVTPVN
jgi:hypothetical protein